MDIIIGDDEPFEEVFRKEVKKSENSQESSEVKFVEPDKEPFRENPFLRSWYDSLNEKNEPPKPESDRSGFSGYEKQKTNKNGYGALSGLSGGDTKKPGKIPPAEKISRLNRIEKL